MTPPPKGNAEHVSGKLIGVERQWADGGITAKQRTSRTRPDGHFSL
jgi:hypothetical protein